MSISSLENSPIQAVRSTGSVSDLEQETHSPGSSCSGDHAPPSDRPERMREWIIRMINSGRFPGLEWLNKEKDIFRVPWIHAKKRGYCRKRDAAIFREWAIHSGKYREDGDPTTWKINFRCAINGLKDIMEIKDMQQEDCRVYKVLPSRGRIRRRRAARHEPYPASCTAPTSYCGMSDGSCVVTPHYSYGMPATATHPTPLFDSTYPGFPANIKMEPLSFEPGMSMYQPLHISTASSTYSSSSSMMGNNGHSGPSMFYTNTSMHDSLLSEASYLEQKPHIQEQKLQPFLPPVTTVVNPKSDIIPFCRHDSPDSGIGTDPRSSPLLSQSSPQHSPAALVSQQQHSPIPQNSPVMAQQHSPAMAQQNSPIMPQQHSPVMTNFQMGMPSPDSVASNAGPALNGDAVAQFFDELESNPSSSPIPRTPPPPANEAHIRVFYGTIPILSKTVDCSNGCRIHANSDSNRIHGEEAHNICLPNSHAHSSAREIFDAMKLGVVIKSQNGNIYVTPLCRTMVYCGNSSSSTPFLLDKDKCTKVFDYNSHFRPALEHYALIPGESPSPYFILSLGQTWGPGRHVTENLVSIIITHAQAKHEMEAIGLTHLLTKDLLIDLPDSVDIDQATETDLEAEAFFSKYQDM